MSTKPLKGGIYLCVNDNHVYERWKKKGLLDLTFLIVFPSVILVADRKFIKYLVKLAALK